MTKDQFLNSWAKELAIDSTMSDIDAKEFLHDFYDKVIGFIQYMSKEESWISIKDMFPDKSCKILACSEEGVIGVEEFKKGDRSIYCDSTDSGYATHWMPLPEKPLAAFGKEGEK